MDLHFITVKEGFYSFNQYLPFSEALTLKKVGLLWCLCLQAPKCFSIAFTGLNQL